MNSGGAHFFLPNFVGEKGMSGRRLALLRWHCTTLVIDFLLARPHIRRMTIDPSATLQGAAVSSVRVAGAARGRRSLAVAPAAIPQCRERSTVRAPAEIAGIAIIQQSPAKPASDAGPDLVAANSANCGNPLSGSCSNPLVVPTEAERRVSCSESDSRRRAKTPITEITENRLAARDDIQCVVARRPIDSKRIGGKRLKSKPWWFSRGSTTRLEKRYRNYREYQNSQKRRTWCVWQRVQITGASRCATCEA